MSTVNKPGGAVAVLADIDPRLIHRREEVDAALKVGDIKKLKAIILEAGLDWQEPVLRETDSSSDEC